MKRTDVIFIALTMLFLFSTVGPIAIGVARWQIRRGQKVPSAGGYIAVVLIITAACITLGIAAHVIASFCGTVK